MAAKDLPIHQRALLTQGEGAAYAGLGREVVRAWMREPDFPVIVKPPLNEPRIVRAEFDRWLADQALTTTATVCRQCWRRLDPDGSCPAHPVRRELAA